MNLPQMFLGLAASLAVLAVPQDDPAPKPEPKPIAVAGDAAPSITLNDQAGTLVTVGGASDQWTVLAFYPMALTGG